MFFVSPYYAMLLRFVCIWRRSCELNLLIFLFNTVTGIWFTYYRLFKSRNMSNFQSAKEIDGLREATREARKVILEKVNRKFKVVLFYFPNWYNLIYTMHICYDLSLKLLNFITCDILSSYQLSLIFWS